MWDMQYKVPPVNYGIFHVLVMEYLTCRLNILCSNPFLGGSGG